jgi:hypothetical protein
MLRRGLASALLVACVAVAGCGERGEALSSSSLDEALRYLPADAPFAAVLDTSPDSEQLEDAGEVLQKLGLERRVQRQIAEMLDASPADIERIEAVLGNDFVIGSTDAKALVDRTAEEASGGAGDTSGDAKNFVAAIRATDEAELRDLVERENAQERRESHGATIYEDDSGERFAVKEDVLVLAASEQQLEAALAIRDSDDGLTEEDFEAASEDVPEDALLRVYLDVEQLLRASDEDEAKDALRSKWVGALRTAGVGLSLESSNAVDVDFDLNTDAGELSEQDLPIATGGKSPHVLNRTDDINLALREPSQLLEFVQETLAAVDPGRFAGLRVGKEEIGRQLKIDVDEDLVGQFSGDMALSIDGSRFSARVEVEDPAALERTLAKSAEVLPRLALTFSGEKAGFAKPKPGEDFYALSTSGIDIVFGVVGKYFVVGNNADLVGRAARDRSFHVEGTTGGALVIKADAEQVIRRVLSELEGVGLDELIGAERAAQVDQARDRVGGSLELRPLQLLTGSVEASTERLSGGFTLEID